MSAFTHDSSEYGNPHKQLASYRKEIKEMTKIKPGHAAYRRLFNFLIIYQNSECGNPNPLDTSDVIRITLGKIQVYLQDRWNRNMQKTRREQMSGRCPTVLNSFKTQKYKKKGNSEDTDTRENKLEK